MGIGKEVVKDHVRGFKVEVASVKKAGRNSFFTWFDTSKSMESSFIRGSWDFETYVTQQIASFINSPEEKIALEIGYGGGRLLASAAGHFKKAIGIDVHNEANYVKKALNERGIKNINLKACDGKNIPVKDSTIDLVYSFIVLQHVERVKILERYFKETHRVLKPGGLAILYFGRYSRLSLNRSSRLLYLIDRLLEYFFLKNSYLEIPSRVNDINLIVSLGFAKNLSKKIGFKVLKTLVSHKKVPDGLNLYGGQHGLVLKKIK